MHVNCGLVFVAARRAYKRACATGNPVFVQASWIWIANLNNSSPSTARAWYVQKHNTASNYEISKHTILHRIAHKQWMLNSINLSFSIQQRRYFLINLQSVAFDKNIKCALATTGGIGKLFHELFCQNFEFFFARTWNLRAGIWQRFFAQNAVHILAP